MEQQQYSLEMSNKRDLTLSAFNRILTVRHDALDMKVADVDQEHLCSLCYEPIFLIESEAYAAGRLLSHLKSATAAYRLGRRAKLPTWVVRYGKHAHATFVGTNGERYPLITEFYVAEARDDAGEHRWQRCSPREYREWLLSVRRWHLQDCPRAQSTRPAGLPSPLWDDYLAALATVSASQLRLIDL